MGAKITPATPVIVKSGRKETAMITVEKAIGLPTSETALRMRSPMGPSPLSLRWRKMFSTMITVECTTMPKSMAPREMRLAEVPESTSPMMAMSSASGMFTAVMRAARQLPRKRISTTVTSPMPMSRFSITVCVVREIRSLRS